MTADALTVSKKLKHRPRVFNPTPESRCDPSPTGAHRWRLASTGHDIPATCKDCGKERVFSPFAAGEPSPWAHLKTEPE